MRLLRFVLMFAFLALLIYPVCDILAVARSSLSFAGQTSSYLPLYYGYEKGFFLQEGLDLEILQLDPVATDSHIEQKGDTRARFLRDWNRGVKFCQDNEEIMIAYILQKNGIKDTPLAGRMDDDGAPNMLAAIV